MKLIPFLPFKTDPIPSSNSPPAWQWPSCGNIKTLSFRAPNSDDIFKMANSAFATDPPDIYFTSSSSLADSSGSISNVSEEEVSGDPVETVIRGLRSERLFFEPGETNSILEEATAKKNNKNKKKMKINDGFDGAPFKESEVISMDSEDPYADFRKSMEEMVEAQGLKDWAGLEELLSWYLRVNGKSNHGYIVGAFIDLLVNLSFAEFVGESSSSSASSSFTIISQSHSSLPSSPLSLPSSLSIPTPCSSVPLDQRDDENVNQDSTTALS